VPKPVIDVLVIGAGVAGLQAALAAASPSCRVLLVNKERGKSSSSAYAQGGIAVALGTRADRDAHYADTLKAGRGLCDPRAVRMLVDEGPRRVRELVHLGARFDREGRGFARAHEGAHSRRRILRARGDQIGAELTRTLGRATAHHASIRIRADLCAVDLLITNGRCAGVWAIDRAGRRVILHARAVILATGGLGQVYLRTTNPAVATGDGLAMAYRAGAVIQDIEFVQFHPTALALPGAPSFLLSEAMRGEGAILRNRDGQAFMARYDRRRELAPRDVVALAIRDEMVRTGSDHVWLDITARPRNWIRERFPLIARTCARYGLDIATDPIPVAPAAHFAIGGVRTDVSGMTSLIGLYAVGEVACTGVHGANRLASNSLLEGLVFGVRAGRAAARHAAASRGHRSRHDLCESPAFGQDMGDIGDIRDRIRRLMWNDAGLVRTSDSLTRALKQLDRWRWIQATTPRDRAGTEVKNLHLVATLIARAALRREGSLGTHVRADFPTKGLGWRTHYTMARGDERASPADTLAGAG